MKKVFVLVLSLAFLLSPNITNARSKKVQKPFFVVQTKRVKTQCFPPKLLNILKYINKKTGKLVIVTSGHRKRGKRNSLHKTCMAADIKVIGYSGYQLKAIARKAPNIGGIGTYRRNSTLLHVDIGPRREWRH